MYSRSSCRQFLKRSLAVYLDKDQIWVIRKILEFAWVHFDVAWWKLWHINAVSDVSPKEKWSPATRHLTNIVECLAVHTGQ